MPVDDAEFKALTKYLAAQDTKLAVMDEKLTRLVEHAVKVNGSLERGRLRLEVVEKTTELTAKAVSEIPTLRERLTETRESIDAHAQGCALKGVVEALKGQVDTGDTTAGKIAVAAKREAESITAWRNRVVGAISLLAFVIGGFGALMLAIAEHWLPVK